MGLRFKTPGIEVAIHTNENGCGNPCPPGSTCSSCGPFWDNLRASQQFDAQGSFTFNGGPVNRRPVVNASKSTLEFPTYRHRAAGR